MNIRPAVPSFPLAFGLLTAALTAQGVQPLSGTYRVGSIGTYFGGPCPTQGPGIVADNGVLTFTPAGALALVFAVRDVCAGGQVMQITETDSGIYTVGTDGILTLDFDPLNPGTDVARLFVRADGSVALHARTQGDPETSQAIAVALSSGMSNASLLGDYHLARLVLRNDASGLSSVSDLGVVTFDGSGGFVESGLRHSVAPNGSRVNANYNAAGAYTVAGDGTLTVGAIPNGAVSNDRELFFWLHAVGLEAGLTVGVRRGTAYDSALARGAWGVTNLDISHGTGPNNPSYYTDFARVDLTPSSATAGVVTGSSIAFETNPSGTTDVSGPLAGTFAINAIGELPLTVGGPSALPARLSADGTFMVGRTMDDWAGGLLLGLHRCAFAQQYGIATPGAGGIAPSLDTSGGFPYLGNAGFALNVSRGIGGAPCVLVLAYAPSAGIPLLGGTLWFDPSALLTSVGLVLSGASGAPGAGSAALPLAIPAIPSLDGARLFQQAFVLDAGAPAGLAMSTGLSVELCR